MDTSQLHGIYHSTARFLPRGYTLTELLSTVAIMAVLIGMAAPAMTDIVDDYRISSYINQFNRTLNYARSEAIKRIHRTVICKSIDGTSCNTTATWSDGWMSFVDLDGSRTRNDDEPILIVRQAEGSGIRMGYNAFPSDNYVVYYSDGRSLGNGTFTFCSDDENNDARALILMKTGRLRSARTMPDGSPLECPEK